MLLAKKKKSKPAEFLPEAVKTAEGNATIFGFFQAFHPFPSSPARQLLYFQQWRKWDDPEHLHRRQRVR